MPAYTSLTVHFRTDATHDVAAQGAAPLLALARAAAPLACSGRRWDLPVCFDAEFAPDLQAVARACNLSPPQVIGLMTAGSFRVYMLGFQPGFPYMGGLPSALELPRRTTPRSAVPAGSLAVAGRMCAVYPWRSPGGWHLLGRVPLPLFDANRTDDPAWLRCGDEVRWRAIDRLEFDTIERKATSGALRRTDWLGESERRP